MQRFRILMLVPVIPALLLGLPGEGVSQNPITETPVWERNDPARPRPPHLTPPAPSAPAPRPSDAIVLFDGTSLAAWVTGPDAAAPGWKIENGYLEVVPGSGTIRTREEFADVQLHLEWAAPDPPIGEKDSGDSGVILMGNYEIQIVDSYHRETSPADGMVASIYGLHPPLVNATRPPGEWQSYDIFFRAPRFGADGRLLAAARLTLLHNGVLVQNNEIIPGPTIPRRPTTHASPLPLSLQANAHPVKFRNIWIRKVAERPTPGGG